MHTIHHRFWIVLLALWLACGQAWAGDVWLPSSGPFGGYVRTLIQDNSGVLYTGTSGGIFKSVDNGLTWQSVNSGLSNLEVTTLLFSNSQLFAGINNGGGIYVSKDNGNSWFPANDGLAGGKNISTLIAANDLLFAGMSYGGGVYKSRNGGLSWESASNGLSNMNVNSLLFNNGVLFAGTDGGVFKSNDNGATWSKSNNFPLVRSLIYAGGNIYAGTDSGLYSSADNGVSWAANGLTGSSVRSMFLFNNDIVAGTSAGVYKYSNGKVWQEISVGLTNTFALAFLSIKDQLFVGTAGGLFRLDAGTTNWVPSSSGLPVTVQSMLLADGELYVGTNSNGIFKSSDSGLSWKFFGLTNKSILALTNTGGKLIAGTNGYGVFYTSDKGNTWLQASSDSPMTAVWALSSSNGTVWAAAEEGIFKSTDNGVTWKSCNSTRQMISIVATGNYVFAGSVSGVYKSSDGGSTWQKNGSFSSVWSLLVGGDNSIYAGALGGLYKTTDSGVSWQQLDLDLSGTIVRSLYSVNGKVLAGTGGGYLGVHPKGVYVSSDNGKSWKKLDQGITAVDSAMTFSGSSSTLFSGFYGMGIQRMILSPGKLASINLQSPSIVFENATIIAQAEALYDNDYRQIVKPTWSVDKPAVASIAADGTLTALAVTQDTVVTVTATYSEGGVTQSASRQVLVKHIDRPLNSLSITAPADSLPGGASINLSALALYVYQGGRCGFKNSDCFSSPVIPVWRVINGPASINADGVLTAQNVAVDTPVYIAATYSEGAQTQTATLTLTVKKPAAKLTYLTIRGPDVAIGGQTMRFRAIAYYDDQSEREVTPTWTSQDPRSPVSPTGELRVDNATKVVSLVANYSENGAAAAMTRAVYVTKSTAAADTLKVKIAQVVELGPGDMLDVDFSFENFDPTKKFDLWAWVALPDTTPIYMINSGDVFQLPTFDVPPLAYRTNENLIQERRPMLHFPIPKGLPSGTYTFHAAVANHDAKEGVLPSVWVSHDSATVRLR